MNAGQIPQRENIHVNHTQHSIGTSLMTHGIQGIDTHYKTGQLMADAQNRQMIIDLRDAGATTDSSGGTVYSGFGGASATGDSSSAEESSGSDSASSSSNNFGNAADSSAGRAAALQFGQTFGILALAGAFFGGFALVL